MGWAGYDVQVPGNVIASRETTEFVVRMSAILNNDCGVYIITNLINKMVYVGSSKDLSRRIWQHRRDLNNGNHFNRYLQNSWKKYGEGRFSITIICHCALEDRAIVEKAVADQYGAFNRARGFNIGDPFLKIISEETRQRMSNGMKGVNTWMTGRKFDPDRIEKSAAGHRGLKRSIQSRLRYRESKLGINNPARKLSDAQCDDIRSMRLSGATLKDLAHLFAISVSHVSGLCNNKKRSYNISRIQDHERLLSVG